MSSSQKRSWFGALMHFLTVPTCVCCKHRLSLDESALCSDCLSFYTRELCKPCPTCLLPLSDCTCATDLLKQNHVQRLWKVTGYRKGANDRPANCLIYSIKRENRRDVFAFMAAEMADVLRAKGIKLAGYKIAYVPRRRVSVLRYGMDQSKLLAKHLCMELGIPGEALLVSKAKRAQKGMSREQRKTNARYALKRGATPKGNYILVDDVVTTGASMGHAAAALKQGGAGRVIGLCFAVVL